MGKKGRERRDCCRGEPVLVVGSFRQLVVERPPVILGVAVGVFFIGRCPSQLCFRGWCKSWRDTANSGNTRRCRVRAPGDGTKDTFTAHRRTVKRGGGYGRGAGKHLVRVYLSISILTVRKMVQ